MAKFGFRHGSRISGDPQVIGAELEKIRRRRGKLTSEGIVQEASNDSSPLHGQFVWDDKKAGHEFRLIQARNLTRAVVVMVKSGDKEIEQSQYVHVREDGPEGKYEPMEAVVKDVDMFQMALEELEGKLSGAVRAVQELREAAGASKHKGKLAIIAIVTKALETATAALRKLAA